MDLDPKLDVENLSSAFKLVEGDVKVVNTLDMCVTFLTSKEEELTLRMTAETQLFRDGVPCTTQEFAASIASKASIFYDPQQTVLQALCFQTSAAAHAVESPRPVHSHPPALSNLLPFAPRNRQLASSPPPLVQDEHIPKSSWA